MDELYVLARRVLLDALVALGEHRGAAILAGAQAIYLRVGEGDLAVAPYTTDGDLAIDPGILSAAPPLERGLLAAGFIPRSHDSVGEWVTSRVARDGGWVDVAVDLLVPPSVSPGKGRRAAHLPGHDARAVRIVRGLDGVLVDRDLMVGNREEETASCTGQGTTVGPTPVFSHASACPTRTESYAKTAAPASCAATIESQAR